MKLYPVCLLEVMLMVPCLVAAEDHSESSSLSASANTTYKKTCGSCHFAYQPALLPGRSWLNILNNPATNAGGALSLDKTAEREIEKYLTQNSAERNASERSQEILASLGSDTPGSISEVPYKEEAQGNQRNGIPDKERGIQSQLPGLPQERGKRLL